VLLPSLALSAGLLVRQLFFTAAVRSAPRLLIGDLMAAMGPAALLSAAWVAAYACYVGWAPIWNQMVVVPITMASKMTSPDFVAFLPVGHWAMGCGMGAGAVAFLGLVAPFPWQRRCVVLLAIGFVAITVGVETFGTVEDIPFFWRAGLFTLAPMAGALAMTYAIVHRFDAGPVVPVVVVAAAMNAVMALTLHPLGDLNRLRWTMSPALLLATFGVSRAYALVAEHGGLSRWVVGATICLVLGISSERLAAELRGGRPRVVLRNSPTGDLPISGIRPTQDVIDFVEANVPPGGYVLEIPGSLYAFLTGRRQAARLDYFYLVDGSVWDETREIEAIQRRNPRFALVRGGIPLWRNDFPALSRFLDEHYVLQQKLGVVRVFRRRDDVRPGPPLRPRLMRPGDSSTRWRHRNPHVIAAAEKAHALRIGGPVFLEEAKTQIPEEHGEEKVLILGPDKREQRVGDAPGHVLESAEHLREREDERRSDWHATVEDHDHIAIGRALPVQMEEARRREDVGEREQLHDVERGVVIDRSKVHGGERREHPPVHVADAGSHVGGLRHDVVQRVEIGEDER